MSPGPAGAVQAHGSCVAYDGRAALITGASGSGKSALSLQLIGLGAALVADDQTMLTGRGSALIASAPEAIAGMIEARGIGLLRLDAVADAALFLVVDLDQEEAARLPQLRKISFTDLWFPLIYGKNRPNLAYEIMACLRSGREPLLADPEDPVDADQY